MLIFHGISMDSREWLDPRCYTKGNRPRMALIWNGGTIGSGYNKKGQLGPYFTGDQFIKMLPQTLRDQYKIVVSNADGIHKKGFDSTEGSDAVYESITRKVHQLVSSSLYAGVVIAHGTDGCHELGQYVGYALQGSPIPIVLTGSQYPPRHARTDAFTNIAAAMEVASSHIAEVCIAFGERAYRAVTCMKVDSSPSQTFASPHQGHFGQFEGPQFRPLDHARRRPEAPAEAQLMITRSPASSLIVRMSTRTQVKSVVSAIRDTDILVIEGLGEGNIPVIRDSMREQLREILSDPSRIVIVTPQAASGEWAGQYLVSANNAYPEMIFTKGMVSTSALAKALWLHGRAQELGLDIGQTKDFLARGFEINFVGEIAKQGWHYPSRTEVDIAALQSFWGMSPSQQGEDVRPDV